MKLKFSRSFLKGTNGCPEKIWKSSKILLLNIVRSSSAIYDFIMRGVGENTGLTNLEAAEDIEVVLIPLGKTIDLIKNQELVVRGSIANIFLAVNYLKENNL